MGQSSRSQFTGQVFPFWLKVKVKFGKPVLGTASEKLTRTE